MRIGIFDSGFGGLHIARSIVRRLPQYDYLYLGDTARAPYGHRSQETIHRYTKQAIDFFFTKKCALIIIACNTASSEALRRLQRECIDRPRSQKRILGVLIPAAEVAVRETQNQRIGVIATEATVASKSFVRELTKLDPKVNIFQNACPLLVPLVETGRQHSPETRIILKKYLKPLLDKKIDTLILGCTHYGILARKIRAIVGPNITIVSEAKVVPKKLEEYLSRHLDLEKTLSKESTIRFYSTDQTDNFKKLGGKLFGRPIRVHKAILN